MRWVHACQVVLGSSALLCACSSGRIEDPTRADAESHPQPVSNSSAITGAKGGSGLPGAAPSTEAPPATAVSADANPAPSLALDSKAAFQSTVHPLLMMYCSGCHSSAGTGQLPLDSDADIDVAFAGVARKVNLRQPDGSRLIARLAVDHHHCWSKCDDDAAAMREQVLRWARAAAADVQPITMPVPDAAVDEASVSAWIAADKSKLSAEQSQYARYVSLHSLYNSKASPDDLNTARVAVSKILNSTARYAPKIVNPVAIDPYSLVYRFDVRDYWGFARSGAANPYTGATGAVGANPQRALEIWDRVRQGNVDADGDDAKSAPTFPNNAGFMPDYVEATQLVYSLSRPDVYNEIMSIPFLASGLERELGVNIQKGAESYQYMTVNDAITINERLMWRGNSADGFYWRSVDQFAMTKFIFYDHPIPKFIDGSYSQIVTTPIEQEDGQQLSIGSEYDGSTGIQAQANEVIFSLPNGLQAYAVFGAGNQRRVDAFTFIVVDPRRSRRPLRLLNAASCMSCHIEGLNRASDDMTPYVEANPGKFDAATASQIRTLYPGTPVMRAAIEQDRSPFLAAMRQIQDVMIAGTTDKEMYMEPVGFMFELAQALHGYAPTESN